MNVEMYRDPAPVRCDACGHQLWLHDHRGCHVHGCTLCGRRRCDTHLGRCPANCPREQTRRSIESAVLVVIIYMHSLICAALMALSMSWLAVAEAVVFSIVSTLVIRWYVYRDRGDRGGSR